MTYYLFFATSHFLLCIHYLLLCIYYLLHITCYVSLITYYLSPLSCFFLYIFYSLPFNFHFLVAFLFVAWRLLVITQGLNYLTIELLTYWIFQNLEILFIYDLLRNPCYLSSIAYCSSPTSCLWRMIYDRCFVTHYLLCIAQYLSLISYLLLLSKHCLLLIAYYSSLITYHLSFITYHLLLITSHFSLLTSWLIVIT